MSNSYIGYHFTIEPKELGSEILIAELGEKAFESFTETETGIDAFVQKDLWDDTILDDVYILQSEEFKIDYTYEEIEQVNWNEEWEKNFEPIEVDGKCHVRAPFHPKTEAEFDIVIEPKMSFGTGHHETTSLMTKALFDVDLTDKTVLDAGTGTGLLAFVAKKRGASFVRGFDIDEWSVENSIENAELNECAEIPFGLGTIADEDDTAYDVLLANINRNILLAEMAEYAARIKPGGLLFLSGFYTEDIPLLLESAEKQQLNFIAQASKNNWACLQLRKKP